MKKVASGILGFDDIALGGLPAGRTTLIEGGSGTGKTVFSLQMLVHGARDLGEPGIFVSFEEDPVKLKENASAFDWGTAALSDADLFYMDARPNIDVVRAGEFDIGGMLALVQARVEAMGAKRIVIDAIDILLAEMVDPAAMRREVYRLQSWLTKLELTAIITTKGLHGQPAFTDLPSTEFIQFMVDCAVALTNTIVNEVSQRTLRITKYRGSSFHENAIPFVIGPSGIDVAFTHGYRQQDVPLSHERISSGVDELDGMLQGGYFRGACVLLTGLPGTAKTTLCGAFVRATCQRGERALFISFVSREEEILFNLKSVSIDLSPFVDSGLLRMVSTRASSGSAETHLLSIRALAKVHGADCIVTDPLSALAKSGNRGTAPGVSERLIDWAKAEGRTVLCTSLLDDAEEPTEATPLQISTIADTWIHLTNNVCAGERTRGLSIVKSRGTDHSNQVHTLLLSDSGISLTDNLMTCPGPASNDRRQDRRKIDRKGERADRGRGSPEADSDAG